MEVVVPCCAELDVRQGSVVARVNGAGRGGLSEEDVRTLVAMRDELTAT